MTIHVTIKNEDSRANAVIEVLSVDSYTGRVANGDPLPSQVYTTSQAILKGGESVKVYVTSTMKLEVIERQNG
jgi:hypothetical protein